MAYLIQFLLFLTPFVAFWVWRRYYPTAEPSTVVLVAAGLAVIAGIGGAIWYGLSRSVDREMIYVAPRWVGEGEEIEPGRAEPGRPVAAPARRPEQRPMTRRTDPAVPTAPEPR